MIFFIFNLSLSLPLLCFNYITKINGGQEKSVVDEKRCPHCGIVKPTSEYGVNRTRKDGLSGYCKSCSRELYKHYKKTYFERHPDAHRNAYHKHRESALKTSKTYRASRLDLLWSLKTPCVKCGETRKCSIHFHHIVPDNKSVNLSSPSIGKERILEEVKKCVCLCANCHEEYHYIYGSNPENPEETLKKYLGGNSNV